MRRICNLYSANPINIGAIEGNVGIQDLNTGDTITEVYYDNGLQQGLERLANEEAVRKIDDAVIVSVDHVLQVEGKTSVGYAVGLQNLKKFTEFRKS